MGAVLWPLLAIAATIAEVVASVHHEGDVARLHAAGIFVDSPAGSGAMAAARAAQALVAASIIESPPARNKGGIKKKDTRVLKLTAQAIRSAGGGRIVSCKSAKDRTSMSVTAEQVALLRRRHELPETEAQPLLDAQPCDYANQPALLGRTIAMLAPGGLDDDYPYACAPGLYGGSNATDEQSSPMCSGRCPAGKFCSGATIVPIVKSSTAAHTAARA
mgnify:CR=1 FL=1